MPIYVIWDEGDDDFHYGDGKWGNDIDQAQEYLTMSEAEEGLDDVDSDNVFHGPGSSWRFHIIEKREKNDGEVA